MSRYSAIVMDHFQAPRNRGRIVDSNAIIGLDGVPGRGRYFVVYLKLSGKIVEKALFECNGCGVTIATGSILTDMITNKSVSDCSELNVESLLTEMGGLPPDKRYCAEFAIFALRDAVRQALSRLG
ncbi:MAG: iscU [Planctomycetaceae bacterium]|nr:iscU [Planctomycetaceae bacterium]